MALRRLLQPIWRKYSAGNRGAGALEYALLIFVVLVAGFVAWKYLGGSVSGSTKNAETKFNKGGDTSGQTGGGGGGSGGSDQSQGQTSGGGGGGGQQAAQGGGGGGGQKSGTTGGAAVATVQKPGQGGPVEARGPISGRGGAVEEGPKKKNWLKYFMIGLLVIGLMAAVYTFGKKKSTA